MSESLPNHVNSGDPRNATVIIVNDDSEYQVLLINWQILF